MGLFSKSGKNKQDSAGIDSGYYTSADDQALTERARSKRAASADGPAKRGRAGKEVDDPVLPEKKRARRRLVGAIALALLVAIGLPMVLDSEPKPLASDIDIKIPSKDKPADAAPPAPALPAAASASAPAVPVPASAALDKSEEIVADPARLGKPALAVTAAPPVAGVNAVDQRPVKDAAKEAAAKLAKAEADTKAKADTDARTRELKEAKAKLEAEHKEAKAKADAKVDAEHKEAKAETKPLALKDAAKPAATEDAARAMAILEGKPADASQKFVLQVAALATQDKVDELQEKLSVAGIKSFTQKVPTASGERTRIRVGPFNSKEEAEKVRAKLSKLGLNGSLVPV